MTKRLAAILLFFSLTVSLCIPSFADTSFDFKNGSFKILHLTDTQDDAYPASQLQSFLREAIAREQPDLIVFTGDLVEDARYFDAFTDSRPGFDGVVTKNLKGDIDTEKTLADIEKATDAVFSFFEESGIPYVVAQGNNDHKVGIDNAKWLEIFSKYPGCVAFDLSPDSEGGLDYYVTLRGEDGEDKAVVYLLDTLRHGISDEQIDWFSQTASEINLPGVVFQHIPVNDVGNMFVTAKPWETGARMSGGKFYRLDPSLGSGFNLTGYEPCEQTAEFAAWKDGGVTAAFFGHMHVDGFTGNLDGITLGLTYGCEFSKTRPYGYRVVELDESDPSKVTTRLYTYTGSALKGADFEEQTDDGGGALSFIKNLFFAFISVFVDIFG